jgi:hypothetical protein
MNSNSKYVVFVAACASLALGGCQRAASPAAVQREVSKAQDAAAVNDAKADERAARAQAAAERDLGRAADSAEQRVTSAAYDQAVIDAEGVHRVSMAKCDALAGDAQKSCKDAADATLAMAKAYARASLAQR